MVSNIQKLTMKKILITAAILAVLAGCSRPVLMSDVQWAQDTCEKNGGVQYMDQEGSFNYFQVTCNNGTIFSRSRYYGTRQR